MPSPKAVMNLAKAATELVEETGAGSALDSSLQHINLLNLVTEKVSPRLGKALTAANESVAQQPLSVQILPRSSHASSPSFWRNNEEVYKTHVASVNPESWLGENFQHVSPNVGNLKALDGTDGGTAVLLKDGYVLTVDHSISKATNKLPVELNLAREDFSPVRSKTMTMSSIHFDDGRSFPTELVAYNPDKDLALLKIHGQTNLPGLDLADAIPTQRQRAAAFGYVQTRQLPEMAVSPGTVTGEIKNQLNSPNFFPIDVRTFHGQSGGPIVSDKKVVGIVSHAFPQEASVTYSPKLADIHELLNVAKSGKPEAGVIRLSKAEGSGESVITHEPKYNWFNETETASQTNELAQLDKERANRIARATQATRKGRYVRGRFFPD